MTLTCSCHSVGGGKRRHKKGRKRRVSHRKAHKGRKKKGFGKVKRIRCRVGKHPKCVRNRKRK